MEKLLGIIGVLLLIFFSTDSVQAAEGGSENAPSNIQRESKIDYTNLYKKGQGVWLQLQNITRDESEALSVSLQRDGWILGEEWPAKIICSLRGKAEISSIKLSCFFQHKGINIKIYSEGSFYSNQVAVDSAPIKIKEIVSTILPIYSLLYPKEQ